MPSAQDGSTSVSSTAEESPVDERAGASPAQDAAPDRTRQPMGTIERGTYVAVLLGVLVAGWARRWTSDDAFINFRVVENILAGHGPVFSVGERTEVATSPAWLLLLTVAEWVVPGRSAAWISVVLGLVGTTTGVLLAMLGARLLFSGVVSRISVPLGAVVFLALPPTWDFTTSGLETGLSFAWLGASFWGLARWMRSASPVAGRPPLWLYVLLGLGPLVRPDFALVAGILLLWLTGAAGGAWRSRLLGLAAAAVLPVAYQVLRMGFYGLLVPNTAVAKESGRPLWDRGTDYLVDLVAPHLLWIPGLLLVAMLAVLSPSLAWRRREWTLVGAVVVAAVVHALYVVRVGGDFMHARLLMPSLFLLLCPFAVVPLPRARAWVGGAVLAAAGVWAVLSAAVLRTDYEGSVSAEGIADERGFYAGLAGVANPVTIEDHGGAGVANYVAQVNQLAADGEDLIVVQVVNVRPDTELEVSAPSSGGVVFTVGNAGFYGYASDLDVFVLDSFGLTDPVNSHIEAGPPGRPGHEKVYPAWYVLARYGAPELAERQFEGLPAVDLIAASRAALSCGDLAELIAATTEPMSWDRFWSNVTGAPGRTALRVPVDPFTAERQFC